MINSRKGIDINSEDFKKLNETIKEGIENINKQLRLFFQKGKTIDKYQKQFIGKDTDTQTAISLKNGNISVFLSCKNISFFYNLKGLFLFSL